MRPADRIRKLPEREQLREFEKVLRKAGFSRRESCVIASCGYRELLYCKQPEVTERDAPFSG